MSALEEKKIVIRLPQFTLRSLFNVRFFVFLTGILVCSFFAYWYQAIRPWIWVKGARVEALTAAISTDLAGRIQEMYFKEGESVKKGQVLFTLDRDLLLAKQLQGKITIQTIQAQIEADKNQLGKAMESYLTASNELEIAKQLNLMQEAQEKVEKENVALQAAQKDLDFIDLQIKKVAATAPFDGVVLKSFKTPGSIALFGEPVYMLCDVNQVWLDAEIPEKELSSLSIGAKARIQFTAYPGKEIEGKVQWIGPATVSKATLSSSDSTAIPIKISMEKSSPPLKPGLSACVGLKVR